MGKERIPRFDDENDAPKGRNKGPAKRLSREEKAARRELGVPAEIAAIEAENIPTRAVVEQLQQQQQAQAGGPEEPTAAPDEDIPASKIPDSGKPWMQPGVIETPLMRPRPNVAAEGPAEPAPAASKDENARPQREHEEVVRSHAFQILRDRKAGRTDEEITKLLEAEGYAEDAIAKRFKIARSIEESKKRKQEVAEKIASQTPQTKKALEILAAAMERKDETREEEGAEPHAESEVLTPSVPLLGYTPKEERPKRAKKVLESMPTIAMGMDPMYAKVEAPVLPHIDPVAARIEVEEQDAIDRRIAAAHPGSAIETELKSFDEEFGRLYPPEPGWLTTSAPDDVFDAYHELKHRYRNAKDADREAVAAEMQSLLRAPRATDPVPSSVFAPRLSTEEGRQRIVDTELEKFKEYGEGYTPLEDGTPREWRNKLRGLIEGAKEKLTPSGERSEKMKKYLAGRTEELGEKAKKLGPGVEAFIRAKGEEYNKLSFMKKLLIGGALGVGAAAFSTVSTPLATAFAINLGIQRVAGMSSMFLKIEKYLQDHKGSNIGMGSLRIKDERIKEAAAFGAIAYTAFMGAAIGEGVHLASESSYGQAVHEWLGRMLEHRPASAPGISKDTPAPPAPAASAPAAPASASMSAASAPGAGGAAQAQSAEAAAPAKPEIPHIKEIDVAASKGHGYEYMTKRLWEQLQEKNIKLPSGANPDSDLAKLLSADKDSIDTVVHQLAQENQFLKETGASVRIDLDSHMSIDANGNIVLDGKNLALGSSPTTPAMPAGGIEKVDPTASLSQGESLMPDAANERPAGVAGGTATEVTVNPGSSGEDILIRTQEPAPLVDKDFVVNKFDIAIPLAEPHLYAGPTGENAVYAFGGDKKARLEAIYDYLSAHPASTVIAADETEKHRAIWSFANGKMTSSDPLQKPGFLGIFKTLMSPPEPGELTKLIK